jgi:hypothetical protein
MDYPYDVGSYSRKVTVKSPEAQRWFDRGLNWCFGYHHEEAIACFEKALEIEPKFAMAHWGVSYAVGPNYNFPWELQDPAGKAKALGRAYDAARAALALKDGVTEPERTLIEALPARYPQREPTTTSAPGMTPSPTPCASLIKPIPLTSRYALSSPRRSSTGRPGGCGTRAPASPLREPGRSRRARYSSPPSATCQAP